MAVVKKSAISTAGDHARSQVEAPTRGDVDIWRLPRGAHKLDTTTIAASQQARICFGLVQSIVERGYSATTIAHVCGHAKVSKSTFYNLFDDMESAFLAAYELAHRELVERVIRAQDFKASWNARMRATLTAYLKYHRDNPAVARAFLVESHAVGAAAWAKRDCGHQEFAHMQKALYRQRRKEQSELPDLPQDVFLAVVSGLEEMVSSYVRRGRAADVMNLLPRAMFIVEAVYGASPRAVAELGQSPA